MNWLLMLDGLVLGEFKRDENNIIYFEKDPNINTIWLPLFLQIAEKEGIHNVWYGLEIWLQDRVVPENRIGLKRILKAFGMKKYDYFELAKKTRATLMSDPYWIAMEEDDTYTTHSLRSRVGNFDANGLGIENMEDFRWRI